MAQASKFPAALLALVDVFGEQPSQPANELALNTTINATDLSIVATTNIPASWPASGRMVIDGEVIGYASYASATFTISGTGQRGLETAYGAGVAATHTAGAVIGNYPTAQTIAQIIADLISVQKALFRPAAINATGAMTIDWSTAGGSSQEWNTTGNVTGVTLSNGVAGQNYQLVVKYGGTHTFAFTTTIKWANAVTPTFTSVNGKYDIISLYYNGTDWLGEFSGNH